MKIALVVHDFDPRYGQGRYAVELARRLAPRHDLTIYANRFGVPLEPNWTYQKVPAWRATALTTVYSFLFASERLLREHSYDLIHAQGLTCWRSEVVTAHICNAARTQQTTATSWKSRLFPALVIPLERWFYRQAGPRQLIAISQPVAAEVKANYRWSQPCEVIHHGVDTEQFRPPQNDAEREQSRARYGLKPGSWNWLFVGEAVKGLRQIVEQLPHFPTAELLVITRSHLEPYQQLAKQLGVFERVHWWGPEENIALAYRAADIFVYPSDYDAFGMVVAEAMATGLPVIAGQSIGAAEWIQPQRNGLLCDPHQADSLREQLSWLQHNAARSQALGLAARETAQAHSWDACAQATEAVYERFRKTGGAA